MAARLHFTSRAWATTLLAALPGLATAQRPAIQGKQATLRWIVFDEHHERRSRAAFKACDGDGDDRLSVIEARRCLTGVGTAEDLTGFQSMDLNRDGFLHWFEFDRRFKNTTEQGGRFRFLPARPFSDPSAGTRTKAREEIPKEQRAAEMIVAMANVDDDPHISRAEFVGLLKALNQPANLASTFNSVDTDGSGGLSKAEFVPVLKFLPALAKLVLSQGSAEADPDHIRPADLGSRLAGLHPSLQRWHQVVFRDADRNGDEVLEKAELKLTKTPRLPVRKPVKSEPTKAPAKKQDPKPKKKPATKKSGK